MRHDMQSMRDILHGFESSDCISQISWYVYWIEMNGNRDGFVGIPEPYRPETRRDTYEWEIIQTWDPRIADTHEAGIVHQIDSNSSRDNSDLIPEPNWPETSPDT